MERPTAMEEFDSWQYLRRPVGRKQRHLSAVPEVRLRRRARFTLIFSISGVGHNDTLEIM